MDMVTEIKDRVVDTEELGARERKIDVDVDGTLVRGIQ